MTNKTQTLYKSYIIEEYFATEKPYYVPVSDEVELFESAYKQKLPVLFKGPTGCGKTRFVEYMAYKIGQEMIQSKKNENSQKNIPLVTIACH